MSKMDTSDDEILNKCNCTTYLKYKHFVDTCIRVHGINDVQEIVDAMTERDEPTEFIEEMLEKCEYTILNILILPTLFSFLIS